MPLTFEQIKDRLAYTLQDPEGAGSDFLTGDVTGFNDGLLEVVDESYRRIGTIDLDHLASDVMQMLEEMK